MGIFSSEYKTRVATSVSRVIGDDMLPDSVKSGVIKSLIGGDPLVESIMEDMVASIGVRTGRMYEYGKNHYTYGLPQGSLVTSGDGEAIVGLLLKELYGPTATLTYYRLGPFNNLHYGWQTLTQSQGYDAQTNQLNTLTATKGSPVFLKDMVVVVSETNLALRMAGSLDQWGVPPNAGPTPQRPSSMLYGVYGLPSPVQVVSGAGDDYLRVEYVWKDAQNAIQEESLVIPVLAHLESADYYQVQYTVGTAGEVKYWTYQAGSGTYPEVDAIYTPDIGGLGNYFPFVYLRYNMQSMAADTNSGGYKTSKKLVKYLGMDYDSMVDSVHQNPEIDGVESALMMMAIPANTTNPLEQRYLFDFFAQMYLEAGASSTQRLPSGTSQFTPQQAAFWLGDGSNTIALVIQDTRFKMALTMSSLFKRKKAGTIGPVGSYASELGYVPEARRIVVGNEYEVVEWIQQVPVHYYRHQISHGIYEEIQAYNLASIYFIWNEYLTASGVEDFGGFDILIPLSSAITDAYSIPVRETLYARSLHYVFNSRLTIKVAWYQSEFFKFVLVVASIVMVMNGIPLDIASTIAANSLFVNAVMLGFYVTVYAIKMIAIKLFIKLVGLEAALVVAIVAAMMGMYQMIQSGSVSGAPWAKDLLALANGLSSGVQKSLSQMMAGLADEATAFSTWMDDQTKLLEDANKLLETSHTLSPFVIFGESPDDYYNRTVHSGNIGLNGIEAISSYVQIALTLPKLNETIQGDTYGTI